MLHTTHRSHLSWFDHNMCVCRVQIMKLLVKRLCPASHYFFLRFTYFPLYSPSLKCNINFHTNTKQHTESSLVYPNLRLTWWQMRRQNNTELINMCILYAVKHNRYTVGVLFYHGYMFRRLIGPSSGYSGGLHCYYQSIYIITITITDNGMY
jgi:hypothetical protein